MPEGFDALVSRLRDRTTPTAAERALLDRVLGVITERAERAIEDLPVEANVLQVGSTARETWVSGDRDIDVFVRFPPTIDRTDLETYGLAVGRAVLPDGREEYAEHPYTTGEIEGVAVDLVPCFRVESATEIRSAVDRTPFHTRYLEKRLNETLAADVRVTKTFLDAIGAYGSDLRTRGFSGYLTELLVCELGGFPELIEAGVDWSPPVRFDPEDHGDRTFDDPVVMIDPTDPGRNVAAVLSATNLARFQHYARAVLDRPEESAFETPEPGALSAGGMEAAIEQRGTTPIALRFRVAPLVADELYPQLDKSSAGIARALDERGFSVLRRTAFATEPNTEESATDPTAGRVTSTTDESDKSRVAVLFFELAIAEQPKVERHSGPPVSVREHARSFYRTYVDTDAYGPFIDNGRYVVEREREFTTAVSFLDSEALFGVALGPAVETALNAEYDLLVGPAVSDLLTRFARPLARYFSPRP